MRITCFLADGLLPYLHILRGVYVCVLALLSRYAIKGERGKGHPKLSLPVLGSPNPSPFYINVFVVSPDTHYETWEKELLYVFL